MSFFNCRICTGTLWGDPVDAHAPPKDGQKPSKKETAKTRSTRNKFAPRDEKDVESDLGKWSDFVHPRALDFFPDQGAVKKVLGEILKHIDKGDDPILGSDDKCVLWHGDATKESKDGEESQAVVRILKPGESLESVTFVNRVLPFIFADDESFEELMQLPKEPFGMCCGNQLCINMSHISFQKRRHAAPVAGTASTVASTVAPSPVAEAAGSGGDPETTK